MDKLTIEHIAPYLAYGLKGQFKLSDVVDIAKNRKDEVRDKTLTVHNVDFYIRYCKPILRPLSDLTKEIKHNGEKFVPLKRLQESINHKLKEYNITVSNGFLSIYLETENYSSVVDLNQGNEIVKRLSEWHFDTKQLIDKGLAIDINTLKGGQS